MVEVGRDLQRPSGPTSLLKPGHLQQAAQNQIYFEYLQEWRIHYFSKQPVPGLSHPHGKKVFLIQRQLVVCFSWCPLPPALSPGITQNSLAPFSLHLPFRYFFTSIRSSEPSLLKAPHYQIFQLFLTGDLLPFLQLHGLQYGTNVLFCFPGLKLGDKRDN